MKNTSLRTLILGLFAAGMAVVAFAQNGKTPMPRPTNLRVLPKNIPQDSLMAVMRYWSSSLGVKCSFCHAPHETDPKRMNFASDFNPKKNFARYMHTMTDSINRQYFFFWDTKKMPRPMAVNCYTCHHGHEEPEGLPGSNE